MKFQPHKIKQKILINYNMSIGIIKAKCALSNPLSNNIPGAMPILMTL